MIYKFLYTSLLVSLAFIFTSNSVIAQTAVTNVSATRVEATSVINTTGSGSSVGGESEDIGAPTVEATTVGIEHEDIGVTSGSSKGNVEATFKIEEGEKSKPTTMDGIKMMPSDEIMVLLRLAPGADEESTKTPMNKADLIDSLRKSRAVFVKFDGIDGEASDDTGVKTSKPKEIVVVGSKVRQDNIPKLIASDGGETSKPDSFFDVFFVISTDEDVQLHAVGLAQNDENIKEIIITGKRVGLKYKTPLHVFGFLPIHVTRDIEVNLEEGDDYGRVTVKLPWWHVFGRKTVRSLDLQATLEEELQETRSVQTEIVALSLQQRQAQTLGVMTSVSRALHDAAMNSVRNLK